MTHAYRQAAMVADTQRIESAVVGSRSIELRVEKQSHRELAYRRHYLLIDGEWDGNYIANLKAARRQYDETVTYWNENEYATEPWIEVTE